MLRLLRTYLLHVPTDEDALRALLELLGQQRRFQEAREWLERAQRFCAEEGITLETCTLEVGPPLHTTSCSCQQKAISREMRGIPRYLDQNQPDASLQQVIAAGVAEGIAKAFTR